MSNKRETGATRKRQIVDWDGKRVSIPVRQDRLVQEIRTTNDGSGNPRKLMLLYDAADGSTVDVCDVGYGNKPGDWHGYPELMPVTCSIA